MIPIAPRFYDPQTEPVYACPLGCGRKNFTAIGLRQHWCKKKGTKQGAALNATARLSREEWESAVHPERAGGIPRPGIKIRRFRVVDPKGLTRHGRQLQKGTPFWVKKSSSTVHVDRWLKEGRIKEVAR